MTAAPKPRALRRLSQLNDAKSLGRDKELARRLQKGAAEPSPQSYKQPPTSPPGGRFTGKAARPAPNDGTSPGRTADAYRAAGNSTRRGRWPSQRGSGEWSMLR